VTGNEQELTLLCFFDIASPTLLVAVEIVHLGNVACCLPEYSSIPTYSLELEPGGELTWSILFVTLFAAADGHSLDILLLWAGNQSLYIACCGPASSSLLIVPISQHSGAAHFSGPLRVFRSRSSRIVLLNVLWCFPCLFLEDRRWVAIACDLLCQGHDFSLDGGYTSR
jgi:hypothetical protein